MHVDFEHDTLADDRVQLVKGRKRHRDIIAHAIHIHHQTLRQCIRHRSSKKRNHA